MGGDLALVRDSAALVAVHRGLEFFDVAELVELRPSKGKPLKLSAVVQEFCSVAKRHHAYNIHVDHHVLEPAREHLPSGFRLSPCIGGAQGKLNGYIACRDLIHSQRVRIPLEYARLVNQLCMVISRPMSGGGTRIESPRRGGAHGDLVSGFILACSAVNASGRFVNSEILEAATVRGEIDPAVFDVGVSYQ